MHTPARLSAVIWADFLGGGDPFNLCSVGFNVLLGGVGHFLTAGHCGTVGNMTSQSRVAIGPFVQSWYPPTTMRWRNDNPAYWSQGPWVFAYNGNPAAVYNIYGYSDSLVGTAVCKVRPHDEVDLRLHHRQGRDGRRRGRTGLRG